MNESCTWAEQPCSYSVDDYETDCGYTFSIKKDWKPSDLDMKFCCYCGKPLKQLLLDDKDE